MTNRATITRYAAFGTICFATSIAGGVLAGAFWNFIGRSGGDLLVNSDTIGATLGAAITIAGSQIVTNLSARASERRTRQAYLSETRALIDTVNDTLFGFTQADLSYANTLVDRLPHEINEFQSIGYLIDSKNIRARIAFNAAMAALKEGEPRLKDLIEQLGNPAVPVSGAVIGATVDGLRMKLATLRSAL
ncbi:hypothetical protein [Sphingomonas sp. R-74633]|uniref:hypothetical protein n=1 Tax=Sphingomonas sp. R-74633 TaxID=2751188 RepID=UPI0015D21A67|nr:hypothetical protein [Sphingomonas sp. R-74633]